MSFVNLMFQFCIVPVVEEKCVNLL